jgi:hypothetical protein
MRTQIFPRKEDERGNNRQKRNFHMLLNETKPETAVL